jgi:DNA-binding NarL/FixJ family response regulator
MVREADLRTAKDREVKDVQHLSRPYDNSNTDRQRIILEVQRLTLSGLSKRMIARRLNISPTTVKSYLESKT